MTRHALFLIPFFLAVQAHAHHSVSTHFDLSKTIEIRGTVVDFKLRSPHSSLIIDGSAYVDGVLQSGGVERWEVESSALAGLRRMGIEADTFKPGDIITVVGSPNRQPNFRFVNSSTFITAAGKVFSRAEITPYETPLNEIVSDIVGIERIAGRWQAPGGFARAETPLPLNAAGLTAWRNFDPKLSPANTCESMSFPGVFNAPYLFDIQLNEEEIILHNQPWNIVRKVPINGEPVLTEPMGAFGIVRGRIEGDTIILQSRDYPASLWGLGSATQVNGSGADVPSSTQKIVTERYSVSDDGQTLIFEYTVEDPVFLEQAYSSRIELPRVADDTPMYAYDCEVESASMFSRSPEDEPLRIGDK